MWADTDVVAPNEIHAWWDAIESSWSRFIASSDLNLVNAKAGDWVEVPAHFAAAVRHAKQLRDLTDGIFDPTVSVSSWGYDRDFSQIGNTPKREAQQVWQPATIDVEDNMVRVSKNGALDLGGIGKGLVADMTCDLLTTRGATRIVVDIGGDVALRGDWAIDASCENGDPWARWSISGGGVATSSTTQRAWQTASGTNAHHLIDPRTSAPSSSCYTTVSAHASSAAAAEVAAKIALITGDLSAATKVGAVAVGRFHNSLCDIPAHARAWVAPIMVLA